MTLTMMSFVFESHNNYLNFNLQIVKHYIIAEKQFLYRSAQYLAYQT